jgi:CheY-like chemotaxis protein
MAVVHRPDLIITDLNMDLDGLELIDRLKARAETKDIPILLASSSTDRSDRSEALRRGAMYSIVKPLQKDILKILIEKIVPKPAQ